MRLPIQAYDKNEGLKREWHVRLKKDKSKLDSDDPILKRYRRNRGEKHGESE